MPPTTPSFDFGICVCVCVNALVVRACRPLGVAVSKRIPGGDNQPIVSAPIAAYSLSLSLSLSPISPAASGPSRNNKESDRCAEWLNKHSVCVSL